MLRKQPETSNQQPATRAGKARRDEGAKRNAKRNCHGWTRMHTDYLCHFSNGQFQIGSSVFICVHLWRIIVHLAIEG